MAKKITPADIKITATDATKPGITSAKKGVGGLTSAVKSYGAEMAAIYLLTKKAISVVKDLTQAYGIQEQAETKLAAILKSTGRDIIPGLIGSYKDYASEMQNLTGIGDENIINTQALMATFTNISEDVMPKAMNALLDISTVMDQDLRPTAIQLGKALNDPILGLTALRRIGIQLSKEQEDSVHAFMELNDVASAQAVILGELQVQFGGAAEAMGKTYAGKVKILKSAFGDLKEVMGGVIADRIEPMLPMITNLVTKIEGWITTKQDLKEAYDLLNKSMAGTVELTKLELLNAEQIVAIDQLRNIEKKESIVWMNAQIAETDALRAIEEQALEVIQDEVTAIRTSIRARAALIENMEKAIRLRAEGIEVIEDETDAVKDAIDVNEEWANTIVYSGEALADYIEMLESAAAGERFLKEETEKLDKAVVHLHGTYQETTPEIDGITKKVKEQEETLQNFGGVVLRQFGDTWADVWASVADESISAKEAIKSLFVSLLKSLSSQLAVMAVLYAIALQWGKAAAALAGSIAAGLAAGVVASLQQGGIVQKQLGGYGGGDTVPAMLEPGEMVIRKEVVRENRPALEAMNAGEQQVVLNNTINIDGRTFFKVMTKASRDKQFLTYAGSVVE